MYNYTTLDGQNRLIVVIQQGQKINYSDKRSLHYRHFIDPFLLLSGVINLFCINTKKVVCWVSLQNPYMCMCISLYWTPEHIQKSVKRWIPITELYHDDQSAQHHYGVDLYKTMTLYFSSEQYISSFGWGPRPPFLANHGSSMGEVFTYCMSKWTKLKKMFNRSAPQKVGVKKRQTKVIAISCNITEKQNFYVLIDWYQRIMYNIIIWTFTNMVKVVLMPW